MHFFVKKISKFEVPYFREFRCNGVLGKTSRNY